MTVTDAMVEGKVSFVFVFIPLRAMTILEF